MTPEQQEAIARVRERLKEELSNVSREAMEAESAAFHAYFALGPRINCGDHPIDHADNLALEAPYIAGAFDAAKQVAAEMLIRGEQLPENLARFIAQVLRGEAVRPDHGKGKRGFTDIRNKILADAILSLELSGIKPTKAGESAELCGCDIVADIYDDLLANDATGEILKPKGGEFTRGTMLDIWLKDPEVKDHRFWYSVLPRE